LKQNPLPYSSASFVVVMHTKVNSEEFVLKTKKRERKEKKVKMNRPQV
jgi:hypothetical protein